ncbi:MAG: hypothetical protein IJU19_04095 [Bacteroidales bacterium]|nr:hypothetical protein [Bacteroidales bacterium]
MKARIKLLLLTITIALALVALWQVQRVANQIKESEEAKVRLWASAVGQRNQMATTTAHFFEQATLDERRKMRMYTDILQSFNTTDQNTDFQFSLAYVNYIVDSSHTPIIITTAADSLITVPRELSGQKLTGDLLAEYSLLPPFDYKLWGMHMRLYYKESESYTQLRQVLDGFTQTFLTEITQNSVLVPVVIVDSSRTRLLAFGNLDSSSIATPDALQAQILDMEKANEPLALTLPDGTPYYVYYSSTPLLRSLRWLPLFWLFIGAVLILVSYYLFRTTHTAEQNRIWVGLAKETAHQLGTPLSSLMAWTEYLQGKTLTDDYTRELGKDLDRLSTITHRFSKIGSAPELKESDVCQATTEAVAYLRSRSPRHIKFNLAFPEGETFVAPLNAYLFQWVIENLCKNAIDAMEHRTDVSTPRPDPTITIVASQDARKIYLDIADNGCGMPRSVQRRIFDSGFTTKTRGWGLGLPLARRIINQYHRGRLYLKYSTPAAGSCFRIELKK